MRKPPYAATELFFTGVEDCDDSGPSATCTNDCRFTDAFVSIWVTGLANETITLPLRSGFNYDFTVDWGDGSPTSQITGYDDPSRTHAYAVPGNHKIVITGTMETIYFNNGPERQKILKYPTSAMLAGHPSRVHLKDVTV